MTFIIPILLVHNLTNAIHYVDNDNELIDFRVPTIYQPGLDIAGGNGLTTVYYDVQSTDYLDFKYIVEMALVFADEDHPEDDKSYDLFRLIRYRRIIDIEFIFLYLDDSGNVGRINLESIYAGLNSWTDSSHKDIEIPLDKNGEFAIYVNTWNHALSLTPNPDLDYQIPVYKVYNQDTDKVHCEYDLTCLFD